MTTQFHLKKNPLRNVTQILHQSNSPTVNRHSSITLANCHEENVNKMLTIDRANDGIFPAGKENEA